MRLWRQGSVVFLLMSKIRYESAVSGDAMFDDLACVEVWSGLNSKRDVSVTEA